MGKGRSAATSKDPFASRHGIAKAVRGCDTVNPFVVRLISEAEMKRSPKFFLLGAPKCGTSAIASYLMDHPLVYVSKPKEPHYFCKDLKAGGLPVRSDEEYLDTFFPGLEKSRALAAIDCSVWYLYSRVAVDEIQRFEPDAKYLVMLRNPIEMAWSLYSMLTFQNQEDQGDFVVAWKLQEERGNGHRLPDGLWLDRRMLLYSEVCALGSQLKGVLDSVGRERVHIELLDDLKQDPRAVYLRILEFMAVPDDGRTEFPRENSGRKINNRLLFAFLRSSIAKSAAIGVKRLLGLETLGFGRPDLPMPPRVRLFLIEQFEGEIALIEQLLGRSLAHWRASKTIKIT